MFKKFFSSLFGHISEKDARYIYTSISNLINDLIDNLKSGYWEFYNSSFIEFNTLKSKNFHKLVPRYLWTRIEKLLQKEEEFKKLKDKSDKEVYDLFKDVYDSGDYDKGLGLISSTYKVILKEDFKFEDFSKNIFNFDSKRFDEINDKIRKNKNVQEFIKFLNDIIKEFEDLSEEITTYYKNTISFPENRKTVLTIINVILTLSLAMGTIWLAYSNQVLVKNQLDISQKQKESLIPNKPNLEIFGSDNLILSQLDLSNEKEIKNYARVCVTNNGRLDSGNIYLEIVNSTLLEANDNIENINGGNTKCTVLALRDKCLEKSFHNKCVKINTKIGKNKFSVLAKCANCIENKYYVKDFNFCTYETNLSICD